jgi:hypothetical protein
VRPPSGLGLECGVRCGRRGTGGEKAGELHRQPLSEPCVRLGFASARLYRIFHTFLSLGFMLTHVVPPHNGARQALLLSIIEMRVHMKCSMVGCTEKATGGFQRLDNVGHMQAPSAEIQGLRTSWCEDHKTSLRPSTFGKRGYYLTASQLPGE